MNVIVDTIAKVAELKPPSLPQLSLVNAPDISAVAPLAQIAGTNPAKILDEVGILEKDQDTIRTVAAQASGLIGSCAQDLLGLAMELGTRAMPLAMGLWFLIPPHEWAQKQR